MHNKYEAMNVVGGTVFQSIPKSAWAAIAWSLVQRVTGREVLTDTDHAQALIILKQEARILAHNGIIHARAFKRSVDTQLYGLNGIRERQK